jgi:hypothetical protein
MHWRSPANVRASTGRAQFDFDGRYAAAPDQEQIDLRACLGPPEIGLWSHSVIVRERDDLFDHMAFE